MAAHECCLKVNRPSFFLFHSAVLMAVGCYRIVDAASESDEATDDDEEDAAV
jgi:hypothetical protein